MSLLGETYHCSTIGRAGGGKLAKSMAALEDRRQDLVHP